MQGEAAFIYFGCCRPGRLGTANSNVQHGPGAHTGFSARFDSRYAIATDRPRAVPKHSCTRAPKGGLPHGACCSRATSPTWRIPTYSTAQEHTRAFQPGSTADMRSLLIDPALCRSTAAPEPRKAAYSMAPAAPGLLRSTSPR